MRWALRIDKAANLSRRQDAGQVLRHHSQGGAPSEELADSAPENRTERMAKLSGIHPHAAAREAWKHASDLSRYKDWLTIHKVWRSKCGRLTRVRRSNRSSRPRGCSTGQVDDRALQTARSHDAKRRRRRGVKVKRMAKVKLKDEGSVVSFDATSAGRRCSGRSACRRGPRSGVISANRWKSSSPCSPRPIRPQR